MISVITVVHRPEQCERYLKKSLTAQEGVEWESVEIDNRDNRFPSLYAAYKSAEDRFRGEWLLFVHPDVVFLQPGDLADFVERAERLRRERPERLLFGVAGAGDRGFVVTKIYQGAEREKRDSGFTAGELEEVQTLDACCFLMRRETYERFGFCPEMPGYHLLTEELCLRVREAGGAVCVLPVEVWHLSPGSSLDHSYYLNTIRLFRLHPELQELSTTSFYWRRSGRTMLRLGYYAARNYLHHRLIK